MTAIFSYVSLFSAESNAKSYEGTFVKVSFYSSGSRTASGEPFNQNGFTAASRTLPFGTRLHLTNPATGRSVIVRVNDRGPYVKGRDLDLSRGAAAAIGMIAQGTATLKVVRLSNSTLVKL
ncbi:MAG: septal ring lytic transglycosylase RlpA family protein [Beijerinckiaceae bacterium]|nr:septal ring lytic transglycosylase RlpA family protein [Beijerinckiaceae bacterium]